MTAMHLSEVRGHRLTANTNSGLRSLYAAPQNALKEDCNKYGQHFILCA
jgi:hypothetical protein